MICDLEGGGLFEREVERSDGRVLKMSQLSEGDVGCVVWDAALVLSYFIDSQEFENIAGSSLVGKKVLELGSGTGLVGLQAAINGADVKISDLPEFVSLMQLNLKNNQHLIRDGKLTVLTLKWGEKLPPDLPFQDFVFLSDCLYYEEGVDPLVRTLDELCTANTQVFFCYEIRPSAEKFEIEKKFFEAIRSILIVEEIPQEKHHKTFNSEDIKILRFTKKNYLKKQKFI